MKQRTTLQPDHYLSKSWFPACRNKVEDRRPKEDQPGQEKRRAPEPKQIGPPEQQELRAREVPCSRLGPFDMKQKWMAARDLTRTSKTGGEELQPPGRW
ncbi:hypothetical protein TYRP_020681 [Tyrophagus putrescentiae]|nr:hypothetical protein TYRP_020681 [Tyrophagus putrescentiae]